MVRAFTFLLISLFILLTACGEERVEIQRSEQTAENNNSVSITDKTQSDDSRYISHLNISNNGELFLDNSARLNFFDFSSMKSVIVCPKPNCLHNDAEACSSYGMHLSPFIYDEHIYFIQYDIYMNKDKPALDTYLVRADIGGTGRKRILTFEDMQISDASVLIVNNTLYFTMETIEYKELSTSDENATAKLYAYNFESGKLSEPFSIKNGFGCSMKVDGEIDSEVYFTVSYLNEKYAYDTDNHISSKPIYEYYKYNISDGNVTERDGEYYPFFGSLVHFEDEGLTFYFENGKDIYIPDITQNSTDISIINGFIFDVENKFAVEIETENRYSLNGVDVGDKVIYYIDGSYIVKSFNGTSYTYRKISENDIIGENE